MSHPMGVAVAETLTGTRTITLAEVQNYAIWALNPGGAGRSVVLPAAATCPGQMMWLANTATAAEVLTISADSATVITPTQAESCVLFCNGVKWFGIAGANS